MAMVVQCLLVLDAAESTLDAMRPALSIAIPALTAWHETPGHMSPSCSLSVVGTHCTDIIDTINCIVLMEPIVMLTVLSKV